MNLVTPALFRRYPDPAALAAADPEELQQLIRSTGFFRNKSRNLGACAQAMGNRHRGRVPASGAFQPGHVDLGVLDKERQRTGPHDLAQSTLTDLDVDAVLAEANPARLLVSGRRPIGVQEVDPVHLAARILLVAPGRSLTRQ